MDVRSFDAKKNFSNLKMNLFTFYFWSFYSKIFKVCLAILQHYTWKVQQSPQEMFFFCLENVGTLCKELLLHM